MWFITSKSGAIRTDIPATGDTIINGRQYRGGEGLSDQVTSFCIDSKDDLYFIADVGIKRYNAGKDIFETFRPDSLTDYFTSTVMFEDSKGNYWYGTHNGGLYKYVKSTGRMKVFDIRDGLASQWTSYITEDYKGNIWVGSWGGGITVFSGDKMIVYGKSNGLEATKIHCILEDKEKNMIIADHYTGISVFKGDHFVTYSGEAFLPDKSVFAVTEDNKGRFWFGTNGGISVYDPAGDERSKVRFLTGGNKSIVSNIKFLKPDQKGNIWIGTGGNGLLMYDLKSEKLVYDIRINEYLSESNISALEIDRQNRVWIGTFDRLVVWDPAKEAPSFYTQGDGLAGSSISSLYCDTEGDMWIGSDQKPKMGMTKYFSKSGEFVIIDIGEGYVPNTIVQTFDKTIWVGTTSGLLAIKDDKVVYQLNEQNGLISNYINLLRPQGSEYLFIGTNYGLNRFSFSDSAIAMFTKRNGFPGIETKPNATFTDSKGNLWFGTANGVTMLNPDKMPPMCTIPLTHISSMTVKYKPREMKEDLKLNYKENSVLFNFYSVCLINPDAVQYKVMLKGADEDWSPASSTPMKDYPALSPGHYTFRVKASNGYGYWNEAPSEYSFIVKASVLPDTMVYTSLPGSCSNRCCYSC